MHSVARIIIHNQITVLSRKCGIGIEKVYPLFNGEIFYKFVII